MSGFSEIKNHDNDTGRQSSFDPDKRVDVKGTEGRLETGKKAEFDPDKRVGDVQNKEIGSPIKNKEDGLRREEEVGKELQKQYPEKQGYTIIREAPLRNKNGEIVKDPESNTGRRIDFVVVKDNKVIDSVEVTSKNADKREQTAKENNIRLAGGNYIKDLNGELCRFPNNLETRVERRD